MAEPRAGRRARLAAAVSGLVLLALAGCHAAGDSPAPTPSTPGVTPRPFTVMTTDPVRVADPAAITDASSTVLALNAFQRLMTAAPGEDVLKPDAARDCLFTTPTTYTCTLNKKLAFVNGHPLTSSDVKFSIERATRLNIAGSSAPLLSSLRRIETPDDLTVRFLLSRPDTQFGWALASPAASIVDEQVYDADEVRPPSEPVVGSGPYRVDKLGDGELEVSKYQDYIGHNPGRLPALVYRWVSDSATIEDAMGKGTVDVVWRGLNDAALTRYAQQVQQSPDQQTVNGYGQTVLTGVRVLQLEWKPRSAMRGNKALRTALALALQGDRTSDSVVPGGVPGHAATFPVGGKTKPRVTWKNRIKLTLGYDSTMPNGQDIAVQIRTRLEDTGGLSVQLRPDTARTDLTVVDRKAWTATALAWLQPYLASPLPASASAVAATATAFQSLFVRSTADEATSARLLFTLQKQAAADLVVLPLSQSDEYVYVRSGVEISRTSYGPGWQFGFFGISNG